MKNILLLIALISLTQLNASGQSKTLKKQISDFDAYVELAKNDWKVPGLAVVVVKNNQVIFQNAYGVREVGTDKFVDTNTLFACASTTKAMTAVCMGMLVDEGKLKWSDKVSKYLPSLQLKEPYVTKELTIRDLFLHNSGVGNTDFLWSSMQISSEEILERMRLVEPSYSFRSSFIYQNIFYLAAGQIIEKVAAEPWESYIERRIFEPLGMNRTVPLLKMVRDENQTRPHQLRNGEVVTITDMSADEIGPAGSVWSSIEDIGKWVKCMLDSSKYNGGRLLSADTWQEVFIPRTIIPSSEFYPTAKLTRPNWTTYGLGWFQHDYKGKKVNFHTGSLPGSIAIHGQLPDEKIGVYVFGNLDHAEVRHAIMYKAFDLFALGGTRDWSTELKELYQKLDLGQARKKDELVKARVIGTSPSHPLTQFEGIYSDPLYGSIAVKAEGDELSVILNQVVLAKLSHWHYDTFYGPFDNWWFGDVTAKFETDTMGKISEINFGGMVFLKQ
ncbi:MAG: serine hydrolase [Cyclobacteriaceae bacterium]